MGTSNVLQNKHYFSYFKADCRYYILMAIILIPKYPVLGAMIILELFRDVPPKGIERSPLYCLCLSPSPLSGSVSQLVPKLGASTPLPQPGFETTLVRWHPSWWHFIVSTNPISACTCLNNLEGPPAKKEKKKSSWPPHTFCRSMYQRVTYREVPSQYPRPSHFELLTCASPEGLKSTFTSVPASCSPVLIFSLAFWYTVPCLCDKDSQGLWSRFVFLVTCFCYLGGKPNHNSMYLI